MKVRKEAELAESREVSAEDLELINAMSRKELKPEEVYIFAVRLCDNELDRDWERFAPQALEDLAQLFVGKSGIFDHDWSARGQTARIYRTEVLGEAELVTGAGDTYRYLKGYAYMLRTEGNRELITQIEGGILKEVSVGCAASAAVCSICGQDMGDRTRCSHVKGRTYSGKLCWAELQGITDAYEWSFVAVPAQKRAGVMKQFKGAECMDLRKALEGRSEYLLALERLEAEAVLGRRYLNGLRKEVTRLGGLAEQGLDTGTLGGIVEKLEERELLELKRCYESRVNGLHTGVQLTYRGEQDNMGERDGAFLI